MYKIKLNFLLLVSVFLTDRVFAAETNLNQLQRKYNEASVPAQIKRGVVYTCEYSHVNSPKVLTTAFLRYNTIELRDGRKLEKLILFDDPRHLNVADLIASFLEPRLTSQDLISETIRTTILYESFVGGPWGLPTESYEARIRLSLRQGVDGNAYFKVSVIWNGEKIYYYGMCQVPAS